MRIYNYTLFADYFQFILQDDDINRGDLSDAWNKEAVERLLAVSRYIISVGTARNMDVPVTIEIHQSKPDIDLNDWDQVNLCCLEIETGKIVVAGCTDVYADAARIEIEPGIYDVLVCYKDLDKISEDELEGDDSYHLFIYPGKERDVSVLKNRARHD